MKCKCCTVALLVSWLPSRLHSGQGGQGEGERGERGGGEKSEKGGRCEGLR